MCRLIAAQHFLRTPENIFKQFLQLVLGRPLSYPQSMAQNRHSHTEKRNTAHGGYLKCMDLYNWELSSSQVVL